MIQDINNVARERDSVMASHMFMDDFDTNIG